MKRLALPPVPQGFKRKFVRCRDCGQVAYDTYQPYSLSNAIRTMPCGHYPYERVAESIERREYLTALDRNGGYSYRPRYEARCRDGYRPTWYVVGHRGPRRHRRRGASRSETRSGSRSLSTPDTRIGDDARGVA